MSWSSEFKKFCLNKLSDEEEQLWKTVKSTLMMSIEAGENLFPRTIVGTVVVTLNGRIMTTTSEEDNKIVKYIYGLNPDDLTAVNGNVRLNDKFSQKKFKTQVSENHQKSFAFMLSFIKSLSVDAYSKSIALKADLNLLQGNLSRYNIPEITVNSNPTLCTLDLITGDYILAQEHLEDYINCVSWQDARRNADKGSYVRTLMAINKVDSVSDLMEYYFKRGSRKHSYKNEFTTFLTLSKGLTDIVPIAVKFPKEDDKTTKSGIGLVNNLDSDLFDIICGDGRISANSINCDLTGEDFNYRDTIKYDFIAKLEKFRNSAKVKVFSAPSLSNSYDEIVKIACVTKKDIFELTDIKFNTYSFGVMNFILSCLFKQDIGKILPYTLRRGENTSFNQYLKNQIKVRGREFSNI